MSIKLTKLVQEKLFINELLEHFCNRIALCPYVTVQNPLRMCPYGLILLPVP